MMVRSIHAENSPPHAPSSSQGANGSTSRLQSSRARCHQKITSSAAGRVAVTVLLSSARRNSPSAR